MMNVQTLTQFSLSDTALLAGMLIALACFASLFVPVGAVVDGAIAAFEVWMIHATHNGQGTCRRVGFLPSVHTWFTAKFAATIFDLILGGTKQFAALLAGTFRTTMVMVAFLATKSPPALCYFGWGGYKGFAAMFASAFNSGVRWVILATNVYALPFAKTFLGAKALACVSVFSNGIAALFTAHFWQLDDTKISLGVDRCGAFTAAVNAGPGLEIPKSFSASGASCVNPTESLLAFTATKTSLFFVVLEILVAMFAGGLHKRKPPVARSIGRVFRTLQWQQEAGFTIA